MSLSVRMSCSGAVRQVMNAPSVCPILCGGNNLRHDGRLCRTEQSTWCVPYLLFWECYCLLSVLWYCNQLCLLLFSFVGWVEIHHLSWLFQVTPRRHALLLSACLTTDILLQRMGQAV